MDDDFDSQEFYELMQAYRHAHVESGKANVVDAFEAVKQFARGVVRDKVRDEADAIYESRSD